MLELACGAGGPTMYLAERTGCHVVGLDNHPQGIVTANQLAAERGLSARLQFPVAMPRSRCRSLPTNSTHCCAWIPSITCPGGVRSSGKAFAC
ncbi:MAG: class I SAM-dependent methyltransferase [Firmicutes bacterium]|nr:class I SAM-dependent methyltransferase [Bacillota bacterium]